MRATSTSRQARLAARALTFGVSLLALGVGARIAAAAEPGTATPIKHLVVILNENVSFDHYFATYPTATNPPGEPAFTAEPGTPEVDNLATAKLLTGNPNFSNKENGADAAEPFRLDRTQANTADQNHAYTAEEQAYDGGKADLFPKYTGKGTSGGVGAFGTKGQVMGYFDGNTVTGLWNYAQHFTMSDRAFTDTYGPSTPGALEVMSGQTNGMEIIKTTKKPFSRAAYSYYVEDGQGGLTMINDVDPAYDVCSSAKDQATMRGLNVGDLLNAAGVTWGAFMGGFDLETKNANGTTGCARSTFSQVVGQKVVDYIPHHAWFQYYLSTANPTHARPSAVAAIGHSYLPDGQREPANHEYDLQDFYAALKAGDFPAVSYVKALSYQDGHAGYSDPLDEQVSTVQVINFLEQQPDWKSTAVVVLWDDSDGWYDHTFVRPTNASYDPEADALDAPGRCGDGTPVDGVQGKPVNGRCGPGTRIPFLIVSPWVRPNTVSHALVTQASVVRFVEDNWLHGQRLGGGSFDAAAPSMMGMFDFGSGGNAPAVYLDPATGKVLDAPPATQQ